MTRLLLITTFIISSLSLSGQNPVGTWTDHLSYNSAKNIAVGIKEIFASTGSSIIIYNKDFDEIRKFSRVHGLTETGISNIAFSAEYNTLIISYSSTNIDLVKDNLVYNIPDIKRKYMPGEKEIYKIRTGGKYAYLACSFGIVVVDLIKKEIFDTWKPGTGDELAEVYDISFGNTNIYVATSIGVFFANSTNPGLSYYGNWSRITSLPSPAAACNGIITSQNKIYINRPARSSSGDTIYVIDNGVSFFSYQAGIYNKSFDLYDGGFIISSKENVRIFNEYGALVKTITSFGTGVPNISQAVIDGPDIWIADIDAGLVKGDNMSIFNILSLPGPYTNNVINISNSNGKTYISGGGVDNAWNNQWRPLQVFIHENNSWYSEISYDNRDAMRVLPDPENNNHFYISTWGAGLLEYENNILLHKYDDLNSPLQTIIPGKPYSRICGLAMDDSRNIWITQTGVPGSIKILKSDSTWVTNPVTIEAPTIGDIIITQKGHKWVILPRGYGLFVLDDNNTIDDPDDDRSKTMLVKDTDDQVIISNVYSIAEDLEGNIWVGTDQGPVVYHNAERVFDEDLKAFRIKIPRNDGSGLSDYLLNTETITSISVDGANRKWLGTFSSGAYLFSADGTTPVVNYNEENSPLLSNSIASIAIDDKTGEVWFGTSKGVISVRGDATTGADKFKKVYAFPNPVREDFTGNVTITGLMRDSFVKITDISGNLVFETSSDGGQASWDLKTYNGERVSTGVYLVFCASNDGRDSYVTKMLVIK